MDRILSHIPQNYRVVGTSHNLTWKTTGVPEKENCLVLNAYPSCETITKET